MDDTQSKSYLNLVPPNPPPNYQKHRYLIAKIPKMGTLVPIFGILVPMLFLVVGRYQILVSFVLSVMCSEPHTKRLVHWKICLDSNHGCSCNFFLFKYITTSTIQARVDATGGLSRALKQRFLLIKILTICTPSTSFYMFSIFLKKYTKLWVLQLYNRYTCISTRYTGSSRRGSAVS